MKNQVRSFKCAHSNDQQEGKDSLLRSGTGEEQKGRQSSHKVRLFITDICSRASSNARPTLWAEPSSAFVGGGGAAEDVVQ